MPYETDFLLSLVLTIILELPVIFIFVRHIFRIRKVESSTIFFAGVVASALTLPYLWFVIPFFFVQRLQYIIFGEAFAVLAEMLIFRQILNMKLWKSFLLSLSANVFSFLAGRLIYALIV